MTPANRAFCPLNCGWYNDWPTGEPSYLETVLPPGASTEDIALAHLKDELGRTEVVIRKHLETHTLLEWVQAVTSLSAAVQRGLKLADRIEQDAAQMTYCERQSHQAVAQKLRDALNQQQHAA